MRGENIIRVYIKRKTKRGKEEKKINNDFFRKKRKTKLGKKPAYIYEQYWISTTSNIVRS